MTAATSTEGAPLLRKTKTREVSSERADDESLKHVKKMTPLPKKQMFILCCMRFSEPISYNLIFPFINEMIESVGIANPGYSSGLVEGTFALAQLCTVFYWGSLSDRIGRRPVLLMGLTGVALFTLLFGLSKTFFVILFSRFLIGACNGNIAVLKSAIAELTDETNQGRAFSFLPLSWSVGSIVAPILGGFLARPADQYPGIFGSWTLFVDFPYLLPCLAGASITMLGWLVGFLFFEESLGGIEVQKHLRDEYSASSVTVTPGSTPNYGTTATSGAAPHPPSVTEDLVVGPQHMTARDIIADSIIQRVLIAYIFLALVTVSIDALWVLWLYTPVSKGGVGFTVSQMGVILSAVGVLATFVNLVVFPPLQRRYGTVPLYKIAMALQVFIVLLFPIVTRIAVWEASHKDAFSHIGIPRLATKLGIAVIVLSRCFAGIVFACNMILVSSSAPSRTSLGAVNGVAQMVASSMRALGPSLATAFFAVSNDERYHLLGGQFVWAYMLILSVCGVLASTRVQEGRGSD
ncbi:hypothetical protein FRB99_004801 [Tulasnella sp. 403]|nr:hypothetical protein FRB99_004801 [Tulasnella sp. 403]